MKKNLKLFDLLNELLSIVNLEAAEGDMQRLRFSK